MDRPFWHAAILYAAITIPFVSPLVDFRHLADASYAGDSRLIIWTLAWDSHAILARLPFFDANIYHPVVPALAWTEHHVGIGIFAFPMYAVTSNPVLAYWTVWLLAFPLNALAMHALAWRVTASHLASFVAGIVYAFCFFRMHHGHGHLQLLWTWTLPLVPLLLERWIEKPTRDHTIELVAVVLVAALTSWYIAIMAGIVAVVAGPAIAAANWRRLGRRLIIPATCATVVVAAVVGYFALPYTTLRAGPVGEMTGNAADIAAYIVPPEHTWIGQWLRVNTTLVTPRWIWGEQTLYIGISTMVLAAIGLVRIARGLYVNAITVAVLMTGLVSLALSFGPSESGWAPFDLFARLPGMSLVRAPARFALLVMLALALLAACGAAWAIDRAGRLRLLVAAAAVAAILAESFVVNFPAGKPQPFPVPSIYQRIRSEPAGAVLSLPTYRATPEHFREADYLYFSTAHWRRIVNGFGRQEPPGHAERMEVLQGFPSSRALAALRSLDVRYVVLHTGRASELRAAADAARSAAGVTLMVEEDGDYLFSVGSK